MTDKTDIGGVEVTKAELQKAKKEGALEHVKEAGKRDAETGLASPVYDKEATERLAEQQRVQVDSTVPSTPLAPLLDLSEDELNRRLTDAEAEDYISFDEAKMLLALERAGKNRTGYVKVLLDEISRVIGRKVHPHEVSPAGPPYTNDTSSTTEL